MISKEYNLSEEIKRESIVLHKLGMNIDDIIYILKFKFGERKDSRELINFLFSSI